MKNVITIYSSLWGYRFDSKETISFPDSNTTYVGGIVKHIDVNGIPLPYDGEYFCNLADRWIEEGRVETMKHIVDFDFDFMIVNICNECNSYEIECDKFDINKLYIPLVEFQYKGIFEYENIHMSCDKSIEYDGKSYPLIKNPDTDYLSSVKYEDYIWRKDNDYSLPIKSGDSYFEKKGKERYQKEHMDCKQILFE